MIQSKYDYTATPMPKQRTLLYTGIAIASFGVIGWFGQFDTTQEPRELSYVGVTLVFVAIGAFMIYSNFQRNKLIDLYNAYNHCFYSSNISSLSELAVSLQKDRRRVHAELLLLVQKGFFRGIRINYDADIISTGMRSNHQLKAHHAIIRCESCGATQDIIEHKVSTCDYCRSNLYFPKENRV